MSSSIRLALIVLNWNGRRFLEPCLNSLLAQTFKDFEIVLVDNGSHDGSVEFLKSHYALYLAGELQPRLKVLALAKNMGFAGGNLAGFEACDMSAAYIATLNNDTVAEPDWLEKLVTALDNKTADTSKLLKANSNIRWGAACGPLLFSSSVNAPTIAAAGIEIYRNGLALDGKVGQAFTEDRHEDAQAGEVFGPCAGAALYNRKALEEVGFFDPAFFAYLEDADLAWRLRLAGWHTLYVPDAKVWHEYSGTSGQGSPFKNFQLGRNRVWTILKNTPSRLLLRHLPSLLLYDVAASLYTLGQRNPQPLRGRLAALHPRHWRRIWRQRRQIQKSRVVTVSEIESWLQPNPPLLGNTRLRKQVDKLAANRII